MANSKRGNRPSSAAKPGASAKPGARPATATQRANGSTTAKQPTQAAAMKGGSSRLDAVRASAGTQQRRPQQRRYAQRPTGWRAFLQGPRAIGLSVVAMALVVVLFVILANRQATVRATPVSATLYKQVTQISPDVFAKVGTGSQTVPFKATPANTAVLKDSSGKPIIVYIGAEYCPYCAAERWSVITALSRFGTFSNLHTTKSTTNDTPPDIPTFTFYQSSYTSQYVNFQPVEIQDRNGQTLQQMTAEQNTLFTKYDADPYTTSPGAIPFISIANQFIQVSAGYQVALIQTDTWDSIGQALQDPTSPEAQAIIGNANYLTAAICKVTNNQPANVCTAAPIPTIQQSLPTGQ